MALNLRKGPSGPLNVMLTSQIVNDSAVGTPGSSLNSLLNIVGWSGVRTVYVGKHGSDANDGSSEGAAVLTLARAIVQATALTPLVDAPVVINVLDAGVYDGAGVLPLYAMLYAPMATLRVGNALATLDIRSYGAVVKRIQAQAGGVGAIVRGNYTHLEFDSLDVAIGAVGIQLSASGICTIRGNESASGDGVVVIQSVGPGSLVLDINSIRVGDGATIVQANSAVRIDGRIGEMLGLISTGIVVSNAAARVSLDVRYIAINNCYNVSSGELRLAVGEIAPGGNRIHTGGTLILSECGMVPRLFTPRVDPGVPGANDFHIWNDQTSHHIEMRAHSGAMFRIDPEKVTFTLNYVTINTASSLDTDVAVAGLRTTDLVVAHAVGAMPAGVSVGNAYCSGADTLTVRLANCAAALVAPGAIAMFVEIRRFSV